jgi:serine protease inhibitor
VPFVPAGDSSSSETTVGEVSTSETTVGDGSSSETTVGGGEEGCHALPAAEAVQWREGPAIMSTAMSTPERIAAAGASTWDVALDLLRLTDPADSPSLASSPTSMVLSLGLAYRRFAGTGCATSIHDLMHFPEADDALHATFGASVGELESRVVPADDTADPLVLALRRSMWELVDGSTEGIDLTGDADYGAPRNAVRKDGPGGFADIREVVNCVIEEQSQGLLVDFLPSDVPDQGSSSFDVDVAFLQAPWDRALEGGLHVPFVDDGGSMRTLEAFGGAEIDVRHHDDAQLTVVDVPTRNGALSVAFVLPKADMYPTLADFVGTTTVSDLRGAIDGALPASADVTIPVVEIPSVTIDYFPILAFACDPETELRDVYHGATVQIDEKGIKAAAATVSEGGVDASGGIPPEIVVVFDHPFLFFVHDRITGHVLYSGRFAGP